MRHVLSCILLTCLAAVSTDVAAQISVGDRVRVNTLPSNQTANVRTAPSGGAAGTIRGSQAHGALGTVTGGPRTASAGGTSYTWWNIDFDSGRDGWVASIALVEVAASAYADLVPEDLELSRSSGRAGSSTVVSFSIRNTGSAASFQTTANVRLSRSSQAPSSNDPLLEAVTVGTVNSGSRRTFSRTYTIPSGTPAGQHYIWIIVDPANSANQGSNTRNDYAHAAFSVSAPASSPGGPDQPESGGQGESGQTGTGQGGTSGQTSATARTASWPSAWVNPTTANYGGQLAVTANFGAYSKGCTNADVSAEYTYYEGDDKYSAHLGLDIRRADAQDVYAIGPGVVLESGQPWGAGWRDVVRVQHHAPNGLPFVVTYGHIKSVVARGTRVAPGMKLGTVWTPSGAPAHLHLGLRMGMSSQTEGMIGDARVNPGLTGKGLCSMAKNSLDMVDALVWLVQAPTADDHGSGLTTATQIQANRQIPGLLAAGDADYFKLTVSSPGTFTINTSGDLDTVGELLTSTGSVITSDDDGGPDSNFGITQSVAPGTYYVRVRGYSNDTVGNYSLHWNVFGSAAPSASSTTTQSAVSAIATSHVLATPFTTSGSASPAQFYAGASKDQGLTTSRTFRTTDNVLIAANIAPPSQHIGRNADIYMLLHRVRNGMNYWWYRNPDGLYVSWNGYLAALEPAYESQVLQSIQSGYLFHNGPLEEGSYRIFIGYQLSSGEGPLHYNNTGFQIEVSR